MVGSCSTDALAPVSSVVLGASAGASVISTSFPIAAALSGINQRRLFKWLQSDQRATRCTRAAAMKNTVREMVPVT